MLVLRSVSWLFCLFLVVGCSGTEESKGIAFVQNAELISGFDMRKELLQGIEQKASEEQLLLDSLTKVIEDIEAELLEDNRLNEYQKSTIYEKEFERYLKDKKAIENRVSGMESEAMEQVIERLNEYIKEFAKERGYIMVLGANGEGSILYGDVSLDVTNDLITFCNEKYAGL